MFEELLNKDIFTALINVPKMCKEMDNKRKAIMAAADVDADIEIIRVKGKKG